MLHIPTTFNPIPIMKKSAVFSLLAALALACLGAPQARSATLWDFDFRDGTTSGKTGFAVIGQAVNDFWNSPGVPFSYGYVASSLQSADGTTTSVSVGVTNAPGNWSNGGLVTDVMYNSYQYLYPSSGNMTLTFHDLPVGSYTFYVYGHGNADQHNGVYTMDIGGTSVTNSTTTSSSWTNSVWAEGTQYVRFQGVTVASAGDTVTLTVLPGSGGYPLINGLQIISTPDAPTDVVTFSGVSQVLVGWDSVSGASTYNLKRSTSSGGPYTTITNVSTTGDLDLDVTNGITYYYVVSALDSFGDEGPDSAEASGTPYAITALWDFDFRDGTTSGKTGHAVVGLATNDFWNSPGVPFSYGYVTSSLETSDGTTTSVSVGVTNAPGNWSNGGAVSDVMYNSYQYLYPSSGNMTLTFHDLPVGTYDFYVYGHGNADEHNGVYQMDIGGSPQTLSTTTDSDWTSSTWMEGVQFVQFQNVTVASSGDTVTLTVLPGSGGYPLINGLQIVQH